MMIEVQDATFESDVMQRSMTTPVVVDLWAPWCGPCKTLSPLLEKVVDETNGKVVLAKIDVDQNPGASAAFRVQSIPAVYAIKGGQVVDGFMGAQPEHALREFVNNLIGDEVAVEVAALIRQGDEASLRRAVEMDGTSVAAVGSLASMLLSQDRAAEALQVLEAGPEDDQLAPLVEMARNAAMPSEEQAAVEKELSELLDKVRGDDEARTRFLNLLDELSVGNPSAAADWRKKLSSRLF